MRVFEHLVQVNDERLPLQQLSRAQLWRGLVLRAEDPLQFVYGLEAAVVLERRENEDGLRIARRLDFGSFQVEDHVQLSPQSVSVTRVAASERWPGSSLAVSIEEPQPGALFLRFVYAADAGGEELDPTTRQLRDRAYESADLDTVRKIRQLAAQGALD